MRRSNTPVLLALAILVIAAASIAGALVFEALGYQPCELCLKERIPYYAAIPIGGLAFLFASRRQHNFSRAAFSGLTLIFTASAVLGAYHAGIEWGLWPGPQECSGVLTHARSPEEFLAQLQSAKVVRCDTAAIRIIGLSLAGWNVVISGGLAALAIAGVRAKQ